MKLNLSKDTVTAIAKDFADRYANKGEEMGDEYTAAADDLFSAKRDEHGRIEISRATFDLVIEELDWCYSELARREKEDQ